MGGLERAPQAPHMFGVPRETGVERHPAALGIRAEPGGLGGASKGPPKLDGPAGAEGHAVAKTVDALQRFEVGATDLG